ncbi:hypothetical protein [Streptomyces sp. CBG31]|uniref:hypothetical protein n=1 Tax=Streptomyces sp. CBG31 TaxID=2762623 RepID=UPI00164874E5|nr:hypothetical protein [Streptomyces sp. CBG31]
MTHIYAFQDNNGQWHGDPDAALVKPADTPSRGWLTYQPVPGTPEAGSPFAGQTLAVLYGVTELEPGPVIYQLDSGGRFQATWYIHTLLATPVGSAVIPPQRRDQLPAPSLETSLTHNGRLYALTATTGANGHLTTEITVTNNHGEIQAELQGTLNLTDLHPWPASCTQPPLTPPRWPTATSEPGARPTPRDWPTASAHRGTSVPSPRSSTAAATTSTAVCSNWN